MTVNLSVLAGAGWQFFDNNGDPLTGGLLYTYEAGTTTPLATYTSVLGNTNNTNPIIMDAAGRTPSEVWLTTGVLYDFVLRTALGVLIGSYDDISSINDTTLVDAFKAELVNTADATKGDALVGFRQSNSSGVLAGTVGKTVHTKLQEFLSILDFGADPTGVSDSTAAIQACLTAAGANATIRFPTGTYLLSDTLQGLTGQHLIGDGVNQTILRRFSDYGDTLAFSNVGSGSIKGMWFYHGTLPDAGFTTLTNKATSGAHLHFLDGQGALVEDCWFWRMPYQIQIDQGSLIRINRVHAQGCWNVNATAAAQEGIAGIYIGDVSSCVLLEVTDCYFGGSNGGPQSIAFAVQDNGTQTVNFTSTNAGNLYGILCTAVEGLVIDNCYIGGNVFNNILFNPNNICSQLRISNNFFDGGGYNSPCIQFAPILDGSYAINVTISDNTFNGQLYAYQGIGSVNGLGTQPTIACFTISGNSFINGLGTGIFLRRAVDGVIGNNQIASYNSRNLSPGTDPNLAYAAVLAECINVSVDGNIIGGAINSGLSGGYTYGSIFFSNSVSNVTEKNTVHAGTGTSANIVGRQDKYVVSTAASYVCTGVEDVVLVNSSAGGIQVTLPALVPAGFTVAIKDNAGNFVTYNLTVVGTIDGATNVVMTTNYQSRTFMWNGTQWNTIAN